MKIVFLAGSCVPFHGKSLDERPLGGTETAVIRLAHALHRRGHDVRVVTSFPNPPVTEPLYVPLGAHPFLGPIDALVVVRDWKMRLLPLEAKACVFWTGDAADQPASIGLGDRRIANRFDAFLAVSVWHGETFSQASGFPPERTGVLRNGIFAPYFEGSEERNPKRLFYSSTPYRGLAHLPRLFRRIREQHPDAELHVFSGYDVYAGTEPTPSALRKEYESICLEFSSVPGVTIRGNVTQQVLAREMMKSGVLVYPNTFAETSCITVMEARAAGCQVVTSDLGALPEAVENEGILIKGTPGTREYDDEFVRAVCSLLDHPEKIIEAASAVRERALAQLSWEVRALEFEGFFSD